MKSMYNAPKITVRAFAKALVCYDSNVNDAIKHLIGNKVEIKRENISVGTLEKK